MNRNLTFYAGADVRSKNFRVDDDFVGDPSDPGKLNNAILNYTEIRTGGGLIWKIGEACKLTVEGGYLPYREFDYHRADIRYKSDGGAPYGCDLAARGFLAAQRNVVLAGSGVLAPTLDPRRRTRPRDAKSCTASRIASSIGIDFDSRARVRLSRCWRNADRATSAPIRGSRMVSSLARI